MNLRNNLLSLLVTPALISCLCSHYVQAQGVDGSNGFNGSATATQSAGNSTLTFNNPMIFVLGQGNYQGIPAGTAANFAPISWSGSGVNATLTSNNSPQWTIVSGGTTYQFSIISLQTATLVLPGPVVSIAGVGIAAISGAINRQPTYVNFSIQGVGDGRVFFISNACHGPSCEMRLVPETGSTIGLLAVAALGLQLLRRKLASTQAGSESARIVARARHSQK